MKLNMLSAVEMQSKIRTGEASAAEIISDCLDRIELRQRDIHAFVAVDADFSVAQARKADAVRNKPLLSGIPFAIKDIVDSRDFPVTWGSRLHANRRPTSDAHCVRSFRNHGAVPIGISLSTEFACFEPGKTTNPHCTAHTPGGSSSGSAAAVADFMVPLPFGSQTAASVVRPAAYCGVFAYKASCGYLNMDGIMTLAPSLDSLGVFARSVADLRLAHDALTAQTPQPSTNEVAMPRIGLMRGPHWEECSPEQRSACESFVAQLAESGFEVDAELPHPNMFNRLAVDHRLVMCHEISRQRRKEYERHRSQISDSFASLVEVGLEVSANRYREAIELRNSCQKHLEDTMSSFDILVAPAAHGEAPRGLSATGDPLFSRMWTFLQVPSVTVPVGRGPNGLPLAVQLIGKKNSDSELIRNVGRICRTWSSPLNPGRLESEWIA